jgi:phosphopantetheine--protein transferase-like protein
MDDIKANESVYKISLTLFDISKKVSNDSGGTKITRLVTEQVLTTPCPARSFLQKKKASPQEVMAIQKQVLRFVKVQDKWTALGSTLIKSQAFHMVCNTVARDRTVVELPRTEHRKPYIPILDSNYARGDTKEENVFPLSISHQFPFVGAALLTNPIDLSSHLVGMDIVAFDEYNKNLYSNEDEFLDVFCGSFTEREWECIQGNIGSRMNEFYIRWAMKEAYTKALGVGLGFEFNSFDLRLRSDDDEGESQSLWKCVSARTDGVYLSASVEFLTNEAKPLEHWEFFFLPLCKQDTSSEISGCACVCIGPFQSSSSAPRFQIDLKWTDIDSLIRWHR